MSEFSASELGQSAVRCNLITDVELQDAIMELESPHASADELVRILQRKGLLTAWQAGKLLRGETMGYFLGGYRILYKIASGSFGRVFRADNPSTGEIVAIKVLRRRWMEDARKIELFEREGRMGLSLRHPNIVEVLAVNQDAPTGQYYIVMEFIEGGNLRDILAIRKKLTLEESLRILEESASGLAYAASRGLTHRDIKQTNILIDTKGSAKLVDFGLAEIAKGMEAEFMSEDGEMDRTVDYAGLERATGAKQGDPRSDIFFLGTVFFEMVTGRRLLTWTRDRHARLVRQRFEIANKVRKDAGGELPPMILSLIEKMVAFDPSHRFGSASQLEDTVRKVRAEISGEAEHEERGGPMTVFIVEGHPRLMDAFREFFRRSGFKVLISIDPNRAISQFQSEPFQGLIIDAGTAGEDGLEAFERIIQSSELAGGQFGAILILSEGQAHWVHRVEAREHAAVMVRPVTMKQILTKLNRLIHGEDQRDTPPSGDGGYDKDE